MFSNLRDYHTPAYYIFLRLLSIYCTHSGDAVSCLGSGRSERVTAGVQSLFSILRINLSSLLIKLITSCVAVPEVRSRASFFFFREVSIRAWRPLSSDRVRFLPPSSLADYSTLGVTLDRLFAFHSRLRTPSIAVAARMRCCCMLPPPLRRCALYCSVRCSRSRLAVSFARRFALRSRIAFALAHRALSNVHMRTFAVFRSRARTVL